MTKNHNFYLDIAHQLAEKNLGKTGLNPTVGTVVVKDNIIISSGATSLKGRPHAEFNALNKLKNCSGADLYTTMEPCIHFGKTPPCTNIIVKKKIRKVYFSTFDPDIRTFKKSKLVLKNKGVKTQRIQSKNYKNFYKDYFINKKLSIPFISAKIAFSKDFFSISKKNKWITNEFSRKFVHLLRSNNGCILSTSKTINTDNSLFNCRIDGFNQYKPDLFIVDLNLNLKKNLSLNKFLNKRKTYLITKKKNYKKTALYKKRGYRVILVNSLNDKKDFTFLLRKIYKLGYSRVFLESGLIFLSTFLKNKLINDLYLFQSSNKLKKYGKNNISATYVKKIKFKTITINLNNDKLLKKEF